MLAVSRPRLIPNATTDKRLAGIFFFQVAKVFRVTPQSFAICCSVRPAFWIKLSIFRLQAG